MMINTSTRSLMVGKGVSVSKSSVSGLTSSVNIPVNSLVEVDSDLAALVAGAARRGPAMMAAGALQPPGAPGPPDRQDQDYKSPSLGLRRAPLGPDLVAGKDDPVLYSIGSSKSKNNAQIGVTKRSRVLHTQLDTVFHNFALAIGVLDGFKERLSEWKGLARASDDNKYRIPGTDFSVAAHGRSVYYGYIVTCSGLGEIAISCHSKLAKRPVRLRLFSEYIYACGDYDEACRAARELVVAFFGADSVVDSEQVSTLHLAVDFTGWVPKFRDIVGSRGCRFITPGRSVPKIEEYDLDTRVLYSLRWGKASQPLQVVLYDKTKEIAEQSTHKQYLLDEYRRAGWDGVSPVYRLEFRFNRDELRRLGIELPLDVDLAGLLTFGMDWLSLRDYPVGSDKRRSRWPIADVWVRIFRQAVEILGQNGVVYRRRVPEPSRDIVAMAMQFGGRAASAAALRGVTNDVEAFDQLRLIFLKELSKRGLTFDDLLVKRRDRYMLRDPVSDPDPESSNFQEGGP